MKTLLIALFLAAGLVTSHARPGPVFVEAGHRAVGPAWKDAEPDPTVTLNVGAKVLLSSNGFPDPFDGPITIKPDGTIIPKFCKKPVKIAGLTEEQASLVVFDHVCSEGVYNPKSGARVSVVSAERFKP